MKYWFSALLILAPLTVFAEDFAYQRTIAVPSITSETSVWVPLDLHAMQHGTAYQVLNGQGVKQPYKIVSKTVSLLPMAKLDIAPPPADTIPAQDARHIIDGNNTTSYQPKASQNLRFVFHFDQEVAPTALQYQLASGWIEHVKVRIGNSENNLRDSYIGYPKSTNIPLSGERAKVFEITFTTRQGIVQIAEAALLGQSKKLLIRAEPNTMYTLQYGATSPVAAPPNGEVFTDADAIEASLGNITLLETGDNDNDLAVNSLDNCPNIANKDQLDSDGDGIGDACDNAPFVPNTTQKDTDKDGIGDSQDNCPTIYNPDQKDIDLDGVGWACDDFDNDGIINSKDNCIGLANRDQLDLDNNGKGDACEDDRDGDGIPRLLDNCSTNFNPDQSDMDGDGIGDDCDVCPNHVDPKQIDRDGDGVGDVCQRIAESNVPRDTDGDGIEDKKDICPRVSDPDQVDQDGDGVGDACDNCVSYNNPDQRDRNKDGKGDVCTDSDGDGILDPLDNCVAYKNPDQKDKNENGIGDPCDDDDGDRVENGRDNCPFDRNPYQADEDADGEGNVCDTSDDRLSGDHPWLIWASMVLIIAGLGFVVMRAGSDTDVNSGRPKGL